MRDSRNPDATAAIRRGTGRPVAAVVLLALFEIAAVATVRADITLGSRGASVGARCAADADGDGVIQDDEKDIPPDVTGSPEAFNGVVSARVSEAQARADLISIVANANGSLTISARGDCTGAATLTGDPAKDLQRLGGGQVELLVDFTLTKAATFTYSGTVSVAPPSPPLSLGGGGNNRALLAFGQFVDAQADDASLDPNSDGANVSGELSPGTYEIAAQILCEGPRHNVHVVNGKAVSDFGPAEGEGHFSFSLTVTEGQCTGPTSRWVGGAAGAFDDPQNWDPPQVPTFGAGDGECENALFDAGRSVAVDLSALAAQASGRALVPRAAGSRHAGRLTVRRVRDVTFSGGTIVLDGVSQTDGSLLVTGGARLRLLDSSVIAHHAFLGSSDTGELIADAQSFFTADAITVGAQTDGTLRIRNGGNADVTDAHVGNGAGLGSVTVDGAGSQWTTGPLSVGFGGAAQLDVTNGGVVTSTAAVVDAGLPPEPFPALLDPENICFGRHGTAGAEIRGRSADNHSAAWHVDTLSIGGLGCVEVTKEGGIVSGEHAGGDVSVGSTEAGKGLLFANEGGVLVVGGRLIVGESGEGKLQVIEDAADDPRVTVAGALLIGDSLPPAGNGHVVVEGDVATDAASLTSNSLRVPDGAEASGDLLIDAGGRVSTATTADIGTDADITNGRAGQGIVQLSGVPGGAAGSDQLTRWQIGQALTIGGTGSFTGRLVISNATVIVGAGPTAGSVTIRHGGRVSGFGTLNNLLTNGGTIRNDGVVDGSVVLGGHYDPASTGQLVHSVAGGVPTIVPTALQPLTLLTPSGRGASALSGGIVAAAMKPPPLAEGPTVITGDADFSNTTLVLQFVNGFAPHQGDALPIFQVQGQLTGTFADVEIHGLAPGAAFDTTTTPGIATSLTDAVALPVVSVKAPAKLKESAKSGAKVQFKRAGPTTAPMTVHYEVGGTAENGVDYVALPGMVEIPTKKKSATIVVKPFVDGLFEPTETITIEVLPGDDYQPSVPSTATIDLFSTEKKPKRPK